MVSDDVVDDVACLSRNSLVLKDAQVVVCWKYTHRQHVPLPGTLHQKDLVVSRAIATYHSRVVREGVAEASQIILRDVYVSSKLFSYEKYCRRYRW
jgi:hypothetical protein